MYKLVVCDIDGTLVDSKGNISNRTLKAVEKLADKGIHFTLCTGRNITKTMPIVKKLKLKEPFVCADGVIIYDPMAKKVVKGLSLDSAEARELIYIGSEYDTYIEVSDGYKYYKYIPSKEHIKYDFFNEHTLKGKIKSWLSGVRYVKSVEELCKINDPLYQVIIGADMETARKITTEIRRKGYENIDVRDFLWEEYLFINYKGIGKAKGVKVICDYFGITMEEVMAFGDERNDLDMLEHVGMGIAMANADESVKGVAKSVTLSNNEDGVAVAIEKLILGE